MVQTQFDVLGIGNAMLDVIVHADDAFLSDNDLTKGAMSLIDADTAQALYAKSGPAVECSGGSVWRLWDRRLLMLGKFITTNWAKFLPMTSGL